MTSTAATWPTFSATLEERYDVAERTTVFQFEKPSTRSFKPGQFIDVTLIQNDQKMTHGFSIASAPEEERIMIATRMRGGDFKRALATMPIEGQVTIEGPFGSLALHHNAARPAVCPAGGIGITPPRMVNGLRTVLNTAGVNDDDIRSEEFTGY